MLVHVMVKEVGVSLVDAVKMITKVPAKILGLNSKGTLAKGMDADIVVFDEDVIISDVFIMGIKIL